MKQRDVLPYQNPGQPVANRVRDLLSRMTLEEKVAPRRRFLRVPVDEGGDLSAVKAHTGLPGESRTVSFELGFEHLCFYSENMQRVVEPGDFDIIVGGDSTAARSVLLTVIGDESK